MTVVAAVLDTSLRMVADTGLSDGELITAGHQKIWRLSGNILVGCCGDWGQICQFLRATRSRKRVLGSSVAADTLACIALSTLQKEKADDFEAIVATKAGLWWIDGRGAVAKYDSSWAAIGSGSGYAIGALAAGADIVRAIEIAILYSPDCKDPIQKEEIA